VIIIQESQTKKEEGPIKKEESPTKKEEQRVQTKDTRGRNAEQVELKERVGLDYQAAVWSKWFSRSSGCRDQSHGRFSEAT
jgi:hypothetical protein